MTMQIAIRPYRRDDAPALHAAARESVEEIFAWMEWCHPGYSLAEAEAWTGSREKLFAEGVEYEFAIVDTEGSFLGGCGLNQINRVQRFANLGYWVRTSQAGRGVAPAAVRLVTGFAFAETDLVRLEIVCAVGNRRSQRAAEKSGAVREGVLHDRLCFHGKPHDAVMYAILRSRWGGV
jgi:ribosomal-protein-serine acetyltransferase